MDQRRRVTVRNHYSLKQHVSSSTPLLSISSVLITASSVHIALTRRRRAL